MLLVSTSILVSCQVDNQESGKRLLAVSNDNYLEALGSEVHDKEIVVLGEQDHGDGSVISIKTEIVKYLHENYDFDILIFESDFFSFMENQDNDRSLDNVLKVWRECKQFNELEDYYKKNLKSESPLFVKGIDNTHFTDFRKNNLVEFFQLFDSSIGVEQSDFEEFLQVIRKYERSGIFVKLSDKEVQKIEQFADSLSTKTNLEARLANQELLNLMSVYENAKNIWASSLSNDIRDTQMFENFLWLKENLIADRKCIIWTTNSHGHKDFKSVSHLKPFERDKTNFGTLLNAKFPDQAYHIGFSSLTGSYGRFYTENKSIKTSRNSLERTFYEVSNSSTAFLDFNTLNQSYPDSSFTMSPFGHISMKGKWLDLFDGLILLKNMQPCDAEKVDY